MGDDDESYNYVPHTSQPPSSSVPPDVQARYDAVERGEIPPPPAPSPFVDNNQAYTPSASPGTSTQSANVPTMLVDNNQTYVPPETSGIPQPLLENIKQSAAQAKDIEYSNVGNKNVIRAVQQDNGDVAYVVDYNKNGMMDTDDYVTTMGRSNLTVGERRQLLRYVKRHPEQQFATPSKYLGSNTLDVITYQPHGSPVLVDLNRTAGGENVFDHSYDILSRLPNGTPVQSVDANGNFNHYYVYNGGLIDAEGNPHIGINPRSWAWNSQIRIDETYVTGSPQWLLNEDNKEGKYVGAAPALSLQSTMAGQQASARILPVPYMVPGAPYNKDAMSRDDSNLLSDLVHGTNLSESDQKIREGHYNYALWGNPLFIVAGNIVGGVVSKGVGYVAQKTGASKLIGMAADTGAGRAVTTTAGRVMAFGESRPSDLFGKAFKVDMTQQGRVYSRAMAPELESNILRTETEAKIIGGVENDFALTARNTATDIESTGMPGRMYVDDTTKISAQFGDDVGENGFVVISDDVGGPLPSQVSDIVGVKGISTDDLLMQRTRLPVYAIDRSTEFQIAPEIEQFIIPSRMEQMTARGVLRTYGYTEETGNEMGMLFVKSGKGGKVGEAFGTPISTKVIDVNNEAQVRRLWAAMDNGESFLSIHTHPQPRGRYYDVTRPSEGDLIAAIERPTGEDAIIVGMKKKNIASVEKVAGKWSDMSTADFAGVDNLSTDELRTFLHGKGISFSVTPMDKGALRSVASGEIRSTTEDFVGKVTSDVYTVKGMTEPTFGRAVLPPTKLEPADEIFASTNGVIPKELKRSLDIASKGSDIQFMNPEPSTPVLFGTKTADAEIGGSKVKLQGMMRTYTDKNYLSGMSTEYMDRMNSKLFRVSDTVIRVDGSSVKNLAIAGGALKFSGLANGGKNGLAAMNGDVVFNFQKSGANVNTDYGLNNKDKPGFKFGVPDNTKHTPIPKFDIDQGAGPDQWIRTFTGQITPPKIKEPEPQKQTPVPGQLERIVPPPPVTKQKTPPPTPRLPFFWPGGSGGGAGALSVGSWSKKWKNYSMLDDMAPGFPAVRAGKKEKVKNPVFRPMGLSAAKSRPSKARPAKFVAPMIGSPKVMMSRMSIAVNVKPKAKKSKSAKSKSKSKTFWSW